MQESPSSLSPATVLAATPGCALFDLVGRGTLVLRGKDRAEFLHGLVTNDVKGLKPGTGCYAAVLTPKGKMRADLTVLCVADSLILDTESQLAEPLTALLKGYVFYQDVTIENLSESTAVLHLEGRETPRILSSLGVRDLPAESHWHQQLDLDEGTTALLVNESRGGAVGVDLRIERSHAAQLVARLEQAGAHAEPIELLETARIEAGIPRWGRELDETVLPNEAGLERNAISYNKGCYMGQEIVARIKTYGHVNRLLVPLVLSPDAEVVPGAEIRAGETKIGAVTSVTRSTILGKTVALGYVKREFAAPETTLEVTTPSGVEPALVATRPVVP
ncbi:MAG: glycine cleavage T C-terminal barrel domain-containing protein [Thermoanaerobaculia bacterium]